jgi:UDP-N-acetylmuramate dehydrogenase
VFKNPQGSHAAKLIDEAGLKGTRVGGAQISTKHANFIVAAPGALAADVWELVQLVAREVEARTGIVLEPEVQLIGEFDHAAR